MNVIYTPEYSSWRAMKARCLNPKHGAFSRYGGNGIAVCPEWMHSFKTFLADLGYRPSMDHTLERIDNSEGYHKKNCRWATRKEQAENRKSTKWVIINGTALSLSDAARACGINNTTLLARLKSGWTIEKATSLKPRSYCRVRKSERQAAL